MYPTPDNLTFVFEGDLLESDAQIIAQQCNCSSKKAKGLSYSIAKRFPYADFYSNRKKHSTAGTIKVVGNKKRGERFVVAMFAQYSPGKPPLSIDDNRDQRASWFSDCLHKIANIKGLKSIAFPYNIGCGLAGGDWGMYLSMLKNFACRNSEVSVTIISNEPKPEDFDDSDSMEMGYPDMEEDQPPPKIDYNKFIVEHSKTMTARITSLSVSQKARLLDHLLKDIRADVILSSSKVLDTIEVARPDDEIQVVADKVIPSPPNVGENCAAWKWIASHGEYPQLHEVEFYRYLWLQLLRMGEMWNLRYFVEKYEQMSGRVCHLHDDFFPPDMFGGQPKTINAKSGTKSHSAEKEEEEIFIEEEAESSEGDEPDDGEEVENSTDSEVEGESEVDESEANEAEGDSEDDEFEDVIWGDMTLKEYLEAAPPEGYESFFIDIIENGGLDDISDYLEKEVSSGQIIYPPLSEVFTAFDLCPLDKLKVVVIGQDPYHTADAAMGVAFGHHDTRTKIQPSLRHIYNALENDNFTANSDSGDLTKWCEQGVFLINTALTVREGDAGSHASKTKTSPGPWDYFIGQLFRFLAEERKHLIVMAWGAKAKEYTNYFSSDDHYIITAPHPAASVYNPSNTEFFDHKPFSRANKQLRKWKMKPVDWNLA